MPDEHEHELIAERITVEDYRLDETKRARADAVLATLGYDTRDVVEIRVGLHGGIAVDVLLRPSLRVRTDRWPSQGRDTT